MWVIDMNNIKEEICNIFALQAGNYAYNIRSIETKYKAWAYRYNNEFGVAIEYYGEAIAEEFSNAYLESKVILIDGENINALALFSNDEMFRNKFAVICAEFIDPGINGKNRRNILREPLIWWKEWKLLIGNSNKEKKIYDVVGELITLCKLFKNGEKPIWSAINLNSHDIQTTNADYEVKTTLQKEKTQIHISSQFQLCLEKPLYLIFNRLEESFAGVSVNGLILEIEKFDSKQAAVYNKYIENIGFKKGSHYRDKKYILLESRKYLIDENFPKIISTCFKNDKIPEGIDHIEYDVNLQRLEFENWK